MTSIVVHRKPAARYANNDKIKLHVRDGQNNVHVSTIMEDPTESWSSLSAKLKQVADQYSDNTPSESTVLGRSRGFMQPFVDARGVYKKLYSGKKWCNNDDLNNDLISMPKTPFEIIREQNIRTCTPDDPVDPSFTQKLVVPTGTKIITIGDIHSGLQSLVEIIDNLVKRSILSNDLIVRQGYRVIFLGDLLDRGFMGLELLHLAFRMKVSNPGRMFYINANHEDASLYQSYQFGKELDHQLQHEDKEVVRSLLTYLPSAIYVLFEDNMDSKWIQFCHGGIDPKYNPGAFLRSNYEFNFQNFDNRVVVENGREVCEGLSIQGLRWTDFTANHDERRPSPRGAGMYEYGRAPTERHLERNRLVGIIRGHQDFNHCALLTRHIGSNREMKTIPLTPQEDFQGSGMLYPPKDHWKGLDGAGWEKIPISDGFKDFSVFTTSTAVRSRRTLGYHTYLEVMSVNSEIQYAQSIEVSSDYRRFFDMWGLGDKYDLLMNARYGASFFMTHQEKERWDIVIETLKSQQKEFGYSYGILVLDSYKMFESDDPMDMS